MKEVLFDIETDGLLPEVSVIWCVCLRVIEDGVESPTYSYVNNPETGEDDIDDAIGIIEEADVVIGHNVLGYDLLAIEKLYNDFEPKEGQIIRDTFVMSQMYYANEKDKDYDRFRRGAIQGKDIGRHTLEAWGQRLGHYKGDYAKEMIAAGKDPWKEFDFDRGVPYCEDDIEVTSRLWRKICGTDWSTESIILEHQIAELMILQQQYGFWLDRDKAEKLAAHLHETYDGMNAEAVEHFGRWFAPEKKYKGDPREEFGEDDSRQTWGELFFPKKSRNVKSKQFPGVVETYTEGEPYCKVKLKEFNPNSRSQIIDRLKFVYGWEPVDFTEKGTPEVNDEVLRDLANKGWEICDTLAELFFYSKLLGQIENGANAWLAHVDENGFIHGRCNQGGTRSGRASHSSPNMGQVPKVKIVDVIEKETGTFNKLVLMPNGEPIPEVYKEDGTLKKAVLLKGRSGDYGWECRNLFGAPTIDGNRWWMMGCDLKGVELRCFGHHLAEYDGGAYADIVINGDVHTVNQNAAGLNSRDNAKTFIYACHTMDTFALTPTGWKGYDELEVGDLVLTYNSRDRIKEWKPVLEKVYYEDADVIEMRHSKSFAIKSTPNHRWFVRESRTPGDHRRPYLVEKVLTTEEINKNTHIITNAPLRENRDLAEYRISKFNNVSKKDTDWVQEVLKMSSEQLDTFLAGFMIADGYFQNKSNESGGWNWCQNTGNIQEAALLATYLAHDGHLSTTGRTNTHSPMKVTHLNTKGHITGYRIKKTILEKQPVWCVRTENESWVIRQGDTITISGNTLYGAGDEKIGSIVCMPNTAASIMKSRGRELKSKFQEGLPAYRQLVKRIAREAKRGTLTGLDGRKLHVKSPHSALNLQLQSDGAILAKKWVILFNQYMEEAGYVMGWDGDFVPCAWIHDEIQVACRTREIADHAAELAKKAAEDAGKSFNYRVPIEADSKVGRTWAETH